MTNIVVDFSSFIAMLSIDHLLYSLLLPVSYLNDAAMYIYLFDTSVRAMSLAYSLSLSLHK